MAITLCDNFLAGDVQGVNCSNPIYGKYKKTAYIINKDDIDSVTYDGTNGFMITAITMKSGKSAYQAIVPNSNPYPTTTTLVKGAASNKFNKTVGLSLNDNTPDFIDSIVNPITSGGRYVVILTHERESEGQFEIFGLEKGLEVADGGTREEYNEDTDGGWDITLEEMGAPSPALFIWNTDKATTETALVALLTPAA